MIKKKTVYGYQISPYLKQIGDLRIRVFREFPYLYDGSEEYEQEYLQKYVESNESIAALIFDDDRLVGASTGIPLQDESDDFKKPFMEQNYDPEKVFYCGESILLPDYRGLGLYSHFFFERENHARILGKFDLITFCAVRREKAHPLRPENFTPLDPVWRKYGYQLQTELKAYFPWKDINKSKETKKEMIFWTKEL